MEFHRRSALPLAVALTLALHAFADDDAGFTITPLNDHLYKLTAEVGYPINLLVSVGDDGVLLVDTGLEKTAEALAAAVKSIRDETPKIIINTHCHIEHLGGNALFGPDPVIIAHARTREHMTAGRWAVMGYPDYALPQVTFDQPTSVFFNGEEIRLIPLIGAHCDDDVIVHFTESGVACTSGIVNGAHFPSIDTEFGDVMQYPAALDKLIRILPDGVRIICPHGEDRTTADLGPYRDMIIETMEIVRAGLAAGKDVATLQEENLLADYEEYVASYVSTDRWIQYLADGIQGNQQRTMIMGPLYVTLRERGVDAAIAIYHELKDHRADEFNFSFGQLFFVGQRLIIMDQPRDAVRILELAAAEYPDSPSLSLVHQHLGDAWLAIGDRDKAVLHYRETLALDPNNEKAAQALAWLVER